MKTKIVLSSVILALCLSSLAQGQNIILVANNIGNQAAYIVLLEEVLPDHILTTGTFASLDGNAAMLAQLEAADLIIVARSSNSGSYDDGTEVADWNGLTTPILSHNAYLTHDSRWKWFPGDRTGVSTGNIAVSNTSDPIFDGVTITAAQVDMYTPDQSVNVSTQGSAGNGTLLATTGWGSNVYAARFEAGVEYHAASGQTPGGIRLFLGTYYRNPLNNMTADGIQMIKNAVLSMLSKAAVPTDPLCNAENVSINIAKLTWDDGTDPNAANDEYNYNVYFGTDPNCGPPNAQIATDATHLHSVAVPGTPLAYNTKYYWQIDTTGPNELGPGRVVIDTVCCSFTTEKEIPTR